MDEVSGSELVTGTCEPAFENVRRALEVNLAAGDDVGASAAVMVDGHLVADVWGGHLDEERTRPWERDTIINLWSTTKTMAALSLLLLVDRGDVDVDAPVASYWPEFAAGGKEGVLVRHVLSHTAGLPGWDEPVTPADLYDWERCTTLLADQAPWWEPGTASGYHAVTQAYLVGEIVRRVTGATLGTFFRDELAAPLGADVHIGLDPVHDHRVTSVIPPPRPPRGPRRDPASFQVRVFGNPLILARQSDETAWRRAEIPAANGIGNARSVALVQSVLACGGELRGRRFLSEATCDVVFRQQCDGRDLVIGTPFRHGIGYGLPPAPSGRRCYWGGWGGSLAWIDLDARLCVAFVMNRMLAEGLVDGRAQRIVDASYEALGHEAPPGRPSPLDRSR